MSDLSVTRDEQVWLLDGNTVIVSEDNVAFRIYLGTIAHRSDIFRDLFSLPRPDAATEVVDECPVIRLQDPSSDLRHFLSVICCGKNYYYARDEVQRVPFSVLAALIRLGHKYAVQDVLEDALYRLKKYYPATLNEWADIEGRTRLVETSPADAITVIELARLTDTPSLLPTAYLACTELLNSREHTDTLRALPSDDLHRILKASTATSRSCALRMMAVLNPERASDCKSQAACTAAAVALSQEVRTIQASASHLRTAYLVPDAYKSLWDGGHQAFSVCNACRMHMRMRDQFSRWTYWISLPKDMLQMEVEGWPDWSGPITMT